VKDGWQTKTLGDLFDITSSKRVFEADWKTEGVPFYRAREIVKLAKHGFVENELFISEEMFDRYSTKYGIPAEGDIMVTGVGTLGICYVVNKDDKFYFKDGNIIWLKKKTEADSRFVEYAFQSDYLRSQIDDSVGTTVGTYTIIKAKSTRIPVPPLLEQKRIIAILDEAFEGIAAAVANAEKNLANAHELFDNYLNSVFTQKGQGWVEKKLGDVATFKNGLNFTKNSKGELIKIVGVKDFQKNFSVPIAELETAQIDGKLGADYELKTGDILTVRSNGNKQLIGRCILANDVSEKTSHSGFTIRIRVASKDITPAYLVHFLKSKTSREMLIESGDGANISSLNQQALSALPVSLPPLKDQSAIVQKIEEIDTESKRLEIIYQHKLDNLAELKQAVLQKAFAGELTAQPEQFLQEAVA
jgi:type I restriction enzyme, S subunit